MDLTNVSDHGAPQPVHNVPVFTDPGKQEPVRDFGTGQIRKPFEQNEPVIQPSEAVFTPKENERVQDVVSENTGFLDGVTDKIYEVIYPSEPASFEEHDNLIAEEIASAGKGVGVLAKSVRDKAKAKKAKKIADAGGYFTLTPYQKSLITPPEYALKQMKDAGTSPEDIANLPGLPASNEQLGAKIKSYLPYILGLVLVGFAIWYFVKKR